MPLCHNTCPQNEIPVDLWNHEWTFATFDRLIIQRNFRDLSMKVHGEFVPSKLCKTLAAAGSPDDQLPTPPTQRKLRQEESTLPKSERATVVLMEK
jgi:hypothetical protein